MVQPAVVLRQIERSGIGMADLLGFGHDAGHQTLIFRLGRKRCADWQNHQSQVIGQLLDLIE